MIGAVTGEVRLYTTVSDDVGSGARVRRTRRLMNRVVDWAKVTWKIPINSGLKCEKNMLGISLTKHKIKLESAILICSLAGACVGAAVLLYCAVGAYIFESCICTRGP